MILQGCFLLGLVAVSPVAVQETDFGAVFDEHWERLADDYPFFELYGVDWEAERAAHRPRAAAAESATELTWELARLLAVLPDAHVSLMPSPAVLAGWSYPELGTAVVERRPIILDWKGFEPPAPPPSCADVPFPYAEIVAVQGTPIGCAVEILAAGPVGTACVVRLRWPDGSEIDHELRRPDTSNVPPPKDHFGENWIVSGRVGSIGYIRVRTFDPSRGTLGSDGKMTPILREHLKALLDTEALILDFQSNGGGQVGASDPFLSHFLEERRSYRWGNSNGRERVLAPRSPRYRGRVVALVDEKSASGGEWAARILRDAGRAVVIGGRTMGAEAAVQRSTASDGSVISFGAWPMVEPGVTPFQGKGVELDHALPLTLAAVRELGYDDALDRVRRARYAKALEVLGGAPGGVDELMALAARTEPEEEP